MSLPSKNPHVTFTAPFADPESKAERSQPRVCTPAQARFQSLRHSARSLACARPRKRDFRVLGTALAASRVHARASEGYVLIRERD
jgi:hypothetical protein